MDKEKKPILQKSICRKCYKNLLGSETYEIMKSTWICNWNSGLVQCTSQGNCGWRSIYKAPPKNCLYGMEQILMREK